MAKTTSRKKSAPRTKLSAVPSWLEGIDDVIDAIEPSKNGATWKVVLAGGGELECDTAVAIAAGLARSGRVTEATIALLARLSLEHIARTEAMRLLVSKSPPATAAALLAELKTAHMEPAAARTVVDQLLKDGWIGRSGSKTASKTAKQPSKKVAKKSAKKGTKAPAKRTANKSTRKIGKRAR